MSQGNVVCVCVCFVTVFQMEKWLGYAPRDEPAVRLREIRPADGPRDQWRASEDKAARTGKTLPLKACVEMEASFWRPQWKRSETSGRPRVAVLDDYYSVTENPEEVAAELDRSSGLSKNTWRLDGGAPPGLRVCPPQLIATPVEVCMVSYWSEPRYGLNGVLVSPEVGDAAMDGFLPLLRPGACSAGLDVQDCFLRWFAFSSD